MATTLRKNNVFKKIKVNNLPAGSFHILAAQLENVTLYCPTVQKKLSTSRLDFLLILRH